MSYSVIWSPFSDSQGDEAPYIRGSEGGACFSCLLGKENQGIRLHVSGVPKKGPVSPTLCGKENPVAGDKALYFRDSKGGTCFPFPLRHGEPGE